MSMIILSSLPLDLDYSPIGRDLIYVARLGDRRNRELAREMVSGCKRRLYRVIYQIHKIIIIHTATQPG